VTEPATYGTPQSLTARDALLAELGRTSGAVEWLREQIGGLTPDQLVRGTKYVRRTEKDGDVSTTTEAGAVRHEWLQLYMEERRFLHALCRDALASRNNLRLRLGLPLERLRRPADMGGAYVPAWEVAQWLVVAPHRRTRA
jgi:hypothetical protein